MDRFEYASKTYQVELDRRRDLNAAVAAPAGIVTLFVAAIFTLTSEIRIPFDCLSFWLTTGCMVATVSVIVSIWFLVRAYHSYVYRYVPTLAELENWRVELISSGQEEQDANNELEKFLVSAFASANSINTPNNEAKSAFLYRGTQALVVCLIALAASCPFYVLAKRQNDALKEKSKPSVCYFAKLDLAHGNSSCPTATSSAAAAAAAAIEGHSGERGTPRLQDAPFERLTAEGR